MNKDKAWLIQKVSDIFWRVEIDGNFNIQNANIMFDDISNLIDQLDEPQKPVVPKFVADYIEQSKKDNDSINQVFAFIDDKENKELWNWLFPSIYDEKRINQEMFMRAWLDGYEVEKEPRWVVKIGKGYFSGYDETRVTYVLDNFPGEIARKIVYDDLNEAESDANDIGGEVEEVTE